MGQTELWEIVDQRRWKRVEVALHVWPSSIIKLSTSYFIENSKYLFLKVDLYLIVVIFVFIN